MGEAFLVFANCVIHVCLSKPEIPNLLACSTLKSSDSCVSIQITNFNWIWNKLVQENTNECLFMRTTVMRLLGVG